MNILIIGNELNFEECQQKLGGAHSYSLSETHTYAKKIVNSHDVIFDFIIAQDQRQMQIYQNLTTSIIFLNVTQVSLAQLGSVVHHRINCFVFGFAGLPSFLNREILETTLYKAEQKSKLEEICTKLNTKFQLVDDRVGLVTPRVICMIINEAYYTVEEGTATREDIDLAMKLGTNYPFGPFEWAQKIGVKNVYETLRAVYTDTQDERYKICKLLQEECLLHGNRFR